MVFQPRTYTYGCLWCSQKKKAEKCIFDGKYCPFMPDNEDSKTKNKMLHQTKPSPRDMIDQTIREQCVYEAIANTTKAHWFTYISKLMKVCALKIDGATTQITKECND